MEDITISNGSVSSIQEISATEYTALISPNADGQVSIDVAANVARDAAANGNQASTFLTIEYDVTLPTVVLCCSCNSINLLQQSLHSVRA